MKFDGIEHSDRFEEERIFWVELSSVPEHIQKQAREIDGEEYAPDAFGACVQHDLQTDELCFVTDTDPETGAGQNIFYIDNDGEKHWFPAEIPNVLTAQIFKACRDMSEEETARESKPSIIGQLKQASQRDEHDSVKPLPVKNVPKQDAR